MNTQTHSWNILSKILRAKYVEEDFQIFYCDIKSNFSADMNDTRNKIHFSDLEKVYFVLSFSRLKENLEILFSHQTSLNSEQSCWAQGKLQFHYVPETYT